MSKKLSLSNPAFDCRNFCANQGDIACDSCRLKTHDMTHSCDFEPGHPMVRESSRYWHRRQPEIGDAPLPSLPLPKLHKHLKPQCASCLNIDCHDGDHDQFSCDMCIDFCNYEPRQGADYCGDE